MALSAEQIERHIADLGTSLPQNLGAVIQAGADIAIEAIKGRMNFEQNTAAVGVRDSIMAVFDTSNMELGISMPAHGYFQNFGVTGIDRTGFGLDDITSAAFEGKTEFQFGTDNKHPGINAASFLVVADFVKEVTDYVNENLEL